MRFLKVGESIMDYNFEDFTEDNYRKLLRLAKSHYHFITYEKFEEKGKNILWRHDIDFSVHRALKLAQIEAEENIISTYFIHLHNESYNAMELEVAKRIFEIIDLGHEIGVHFDPAFYSLMNKQMSQLEYYLSMEKEILEKIFNSEIKAFSFHNPDIGNWLKVEKNEIAGLINTYSPYIKEKYGYCSDSNGYWRFRRLADVLCEAQDEKLQVLTHPEWWVPESMSPRDRISRCIDGRAVNQHRWYDKLLKDMGRENIGR